MDSSTTGNFLDWSVSKSRVSVSCHLLLFFFIEIPVFKANGVDPDQTACSAASDLGLHCLPMYRGSF